MKTLDNYINSLWRVLSFNFFVYMIRFFKDIIISILINAGILFVLSYYQFWMVIEPARPGNAFEAYFILGFIFWIVNFWLKKIINIISFPLKRLSFWLISIIINVGILYFFEYFINSNYSDIATVTLSEDRIRVLIISFAVSIAYALLSKLLK